MKAVLDSIAELLTDADRTSLLMLESSFDTFFLCSSTLERDGLTIINKQGNIVAHPAVKMRKDAQSTILTILAEYAMTLRSRKKINSKEEENSDDSPLDNFMKNI